MKQLRAQKLVTHVPFWLGYATLLYYLPISRLEVENTVLRTVILLIPQIAVAYIGMEVLVPRYFIKRKYLLFFGGILVLLILASQYHQVIRHLTLFQPPEFDFQPREHFGRRGRDQQWQHHRFNPAKGFVFVHTFFSVVTLLVSVAYKISLLALKKEKETEELKSENLHAELKFLKSQINPHFLFNALNNIYSLSVIKSEKAPEAILKLSDILRYVIYEGAEEKVPISKEIDYIEGYINLAKLKDDNIENIHFDYSNVDRSIMIEPMLFIPFIENSFKHSRIEDTENGYVDIKLSSDKSKIDFTVKNSISSTPFSKDKMGGIGLQNIKKRLSLLYPEKHILQVDKGEDYFTIHLNITYQ